MLFVPKSKQFDDVYFSAEDGLAETRHVFLAGNDLPARFKGRDRFTIMETGFGTGLNFLAAWKMCAQANIQMNFISIEKYPLSPHEIKEFLAQWKSEIGRELHEMLDQYPAPIPGFHRIVFKNAALTLIFGDVNDVISQIDARVDAWFLDGFKPSTNPEMWSDVLFQNMERLSVPGATIATFTAAGAVKRGLQTAGFDVRKIKGFGRKRDMLVGGII